MTVAMIMLLVVEVGLAEAVLGARQKAQGLEEEALLASSGVGDGVHDRRRRGRQPWNGGRRSSGKRCMLE